MPSRFAEATAFEGSPVAVPDPEDVDEPPLDALPPMVNVVLTTGHIVPPLSQDLK
jgi:hypothetical protein